MSPEPTTDLEFLAGAIANWKTVAAFVALCIAAARQQWKHKALEESFEEYVKAQKEKQEKRDDKFNAQADKVNELDKDLDRLKTDVTVSRQYTAKSLDEFNTRISDLMNKILQGV